MLNRLKHRDCIKTETASIAQTVEVEKKEVNNPEAGSATRLGDVSQQGDDTM